MLLVVSPDLAALTTIASKLRERVRGNVVTMDNGVMAMRVVDLNPVDLVVVDLNGCPRSWLRAFWRRFPWVPCLAVGASPEDSESLRTLLPEGAKVMHEPVDWDAVGSAVWEARLDGADARNEVVASGLEEVLSLLAMTCADAELEIVAGRKKGHLVLSEGQVVHAVRGDRVGLEVACELVSWAGAHVTTIPVTSLPQESSMQVPVNVLLHEVARRRDELTRLCTVRETRLALDELASVEGLLSLAVFDVDNGELLAARGRAEESLQAQMKKAAVAAARRAERGSGALCVRNWGVAEWGDEHINMVISLGPQLALSIAAHHDTSLMQLRTAASDAAVTLCSVAGRIVGSDKEQQMVDALPW